MKSKMNQLQGPQSFAGLGYGHERLWCVVFALGWLALGSFCHGQGTMTYRFEGQPPGTTSGPIGVYTEAGMQFAMAYGPGSLYLSGGGNAGHPDNGTGYLEIPDGVAGGNGATRLEFGFKAFPQSFPIVLFNFVSFDAAQFGSLGPQTLEVVGYHPMAASVTNYFTVNNQFQTFHLDASFNNVYLVDVFNARWSLDNLVVSGVPEPSSAALIAMGGACVVVCRRSRQRSERRTNAAVQDPNA